ncbi:hypothetical protein BDW74DRAFT_179622 [Aspergillus multicolor]|uniref:uncharacterized protein n=1 Tax=Aspergillus multicolor TaxID=41759 RepID=UPI003CCD8A85
MAALVSPVGFGLLGDKYPENGGVTDIRQVTRILEDAGIPCCMTGASALNWFGASRIRPSWEICVPTDKVNDAVQLFLSAPHNKIYMPWKPETPQPGSLTHTFPRFRMRGVSLLETQRLFDLEDLVDGMNFSEEWGEDHLDLNTTTDVAYAERKNAEILASVPAGEDLYQYSGVPTNATPLRKLWQEIVRSKQGRVSLELPHEYFATRFFAHGQGDPRLDTIKLHV